MGYGIADIVEISSVLAADVELGSQDTVQVVHHIVEDDQRDEIAVTIIEKAQHDG